MSDLTELVHLTWWEVALDRYFDRRDEEATARADAFEDEFADQEARVDAEEVQP